jgi:uncharacterized delta-60 repeat protein
MPRRPFLVRIETLEERIAPRAGDLDLSFGNQGKAAVPGLSSINAMAVMPDGRIVLTGPDQGEFGVVRLSANGAPDSTFGTNGLATVAFNLLPGGTGSALPTALAVRPDGGVVVVGSAETNSTTGATNAAVASLTPGGALDAGFAGGGQLNFPWGSATYSRATAVQIRPGGGVMVAGVGQATAASVVAVVGAARFRPDGSPDSTYSASGKATLDLGFRAEAAAFDPNGAVVGLFRRDDGKTNVTTGQYTQHDSFLLARLTPDGPPDGGYGGSGQVVVDSVSYNVLVNTSERFSGIAQAILADTADSRVWVGVGTGVVETGVSQADTFRFLPTGQPDTNFGTGGRRSDLPPSPGFAGLPDGRTILATGYPSGGIYAPWLSAGVYRFTPDGAADPTFGTGGEVTSDALGITPALTASTPDGGAVVIGQSTAVPISNALVAVRLVGDPPPPATIQQLGNQTAVGPGPGGSEVRTFVSAGVESFGFSPLGSPAGGVRTAAVDLTGDGIEDVIAGTGPGQPTRVVVTDGTTLKVLFDVAPFEAGFTGGVFVAAGDLNGDGVPDIVVTPDEGGGPRVRVFDGKTFGLIADFFGIADPNFRGGARAAVGDVNGDGTGDLVVAAGFGGGPRVAVFDGKTVPGGNPVRLFNDFFAFEQTLRNGVFIAAGDIEGTGKADIIAGGGPGGGPRVTAFSAADLIASGGATLTQTANFFAGDPNNRGGIRVAAKNLDGDAKADLVVGAGDGGGSTVTEYLGKDIAPAGTPPAFQSFDAFPGFTGGVFVG